MGCLRFVLAFTVLCTHSIGGGLIGGRFAVEGFFVISGYLMSYLLIESRTYSNKRNFYLNRALRLLPIYYLVIAASFPLYYFAHKYFKENNQFAAYDSMPDALLILVAILNISLVGQDQLMFLSLHGNELQWGGGFANSDVELYRGLLAPQSWTLGLEIIFYLLIPFIVNRKKLLLFLAICSLGLRLYFLAIGIGLQDPWVYRFFPTEFLFFALGVISHQNWAPQIRKIPFVIRIRISKLYLLLILSYFAVFPYLKEIAAIRAIILFTLIFFSLPFLFEFQRVRKFDNFLAQLSYPIYLWHLLVIVFIGGGIEKLHGNQAFRFSAILSVTLLLSWFSLVLVESKINHYRTRLKMKELSN
jgi:peptidoglycan/LPS O-acetylase OafA/YrhL